MMTTNLQTIKNKIYTILFYNAAYHLKVFHINFFLFANILHSRKNIILDIFWLRIVSIIVLNSLKLKKFDVFNFEILFNLLLKLKGHDFGHFFPFIMLKCFSKAFLSVS